MVDAERTEKVAFKATLDELRAALDPIEGDLLGFLATLETWAAMYLPDRADAVVARFRRGIEMRDLSDTTRGDA